MLRANKLHFVYQEIIKKISMKIDSQGWLTTVKHVPSPFFNQRPEHEEISLLVIHNISLPPKQYGGGHVEELFTGNLDPNQHPYFKTIYSFEVSAHCLIDRKGKITQFVSFLDRAWHAGKSSFEGIENCNDFSIGVEMEGCDDEPFTETQYQALTQLSQLIMQRFPAISLHRITGHQFIAPVRKTDPGGRFNWADYFHRLVNLA